MIQQPEFVEGIGNWHIVTAYIDAGYAVVPMTTDGSRAIHWKWSKGGVPRNQTGDFWSSRGGGYGIAVLTGSRSGNLEVLDFDYDAKTVFPAWCKAVGPLAKKNNMRDHGQRDARILPLPSREFGRQPKIGAATDRTGKQDGIGNFN